MKENIIKIIRDACALEENVTEESKLNELSLDSLSFIEVIVEIEEMFAIEFDLEDLDIKKWVTVSDIIKYISEKPNNS